MEALVNWVVLVPTQKEQTMTEDRMCDQLKFQLSDAQTTQLDLADVIVEQAVV